ncbi:hypothetical protein AAG906_037296 [Vitis piasezkii]
MTAERSYREGPTFIRVDSTLERLVCTVAVRKVVFFRRREADHTFSGELKV